MIGIYQTGLFVTINKSLIDPARKLRIKAQMAVIVVLPVFKFINGMGDKKR